MGIGILSGSKVVVGDSETKSQLKERGFGEPEGKRIVVSLIESLFLVEGGKFDVMDGNKKMTFEDLLKLGSKHEKELYNKYLVYKDLRERGLLVRTGLKFGSDFRIYERGQSVGKGHSNYLVHVVPEEYSCSFPEMARSIRLAENVNKKMIYAIVDEEGDVSYYLVDRMKM